MASDTVESQLQDIREQLDVQAEAISKLAGVLSALDGVDSALLGSYVLRIKRLHGPVSAAPTTDAPASEPQSEPEATASVSQ
jgi:hypothetical protein